MEQYIDRLSQTLLRVKPAQTLNHNQLITTKDVALKRQHLKDDAKDKWLS